MLINNIIINKFEQFFYISTFLFNLTSRIDLSKIFHKYIKNLHIFLTNIFFLTLNQNSNFIKSLSIYL